MKNLFLTGLVVLLAIVNAYGQKAPSKFGKAKIQEINMKYPEMDSSAVAEILFDIGNSEITYDLNQGWIYTFSRHVRIKIFKQAGYNWASFEIPLYHDASGEERILSVKGVTYNIVGNEILTTKLEKSQIFTEEVNKYWKNVKFEMPDVKEGSVIDVSYQFTSEFFTEFREWYFQHTIPTLLSEYHTRIPEYFKFHMFQKGYERFSTERSSKVETITFTEFQRSSSSAASTSTATFTSDLVDMKAVNMPPLHLEDYTSNDEVYTTSVDYELNLYRSPSGGITEFTSSWKRVNDRLMDHFDFGQQIGKSGYLKDITDVINLSTNDPVEKISMAYAHVQNNMKWNGMRSRYVNTTLRDAYNRKMGNCADINFILLNLLNDLGIEVHPVALCTRDYGIIPPTHPTLKQLNYVIVAAIVNGQTYLLDATDPYLQPGILPERCLNGQGVMMFAGGPKFVPLSPSFKSTKNSMYQLTLDTEGNLTGSMMLARTGYFGIELEKEIAAATDEAAFIKDFADQNPGMIVNDFNISIDSSKVGQINMTLDIDATELVSSMGDIVVLPSLLFDAVGANPFKLEERKYPVNFSFPREYSTIISIVLPEGYTIDELPQPTVVTMPNDLGKFMFNVSAINNNIQLISKYTINKDEFYTHEYSILKEYFGQIVSKQNEQIVLKKIN